MPGRKKYKGLLLCGCFSFHDSEQNHNGPLSAIVTTHTEAVGTEGALTKEQRQHFTAEHRSKPYWTESYLPGRVRVNNNRSGRH